MKQHKPRHPKHEPHVFFYRTTQEVILGNSLEMDRRRQKDTRQVIGLSLSDMGTSDQIN